MAAAFLTAESQKRLLEAFPAEHRNIMADHVTLFHAPSGQDMVGVPVGQECIVRVLHHVSDKRSQAVQVEVVHGSTGKNLEVGAGVAAPHITVSTAINTAASQSNQLFLRSTIESGEMVGVGTSKGPKGKQEESLLELTSILGVKVSLAHG